MVSIVQEAIHAFFSSVLQVFLLVEQKKVWGQKQEKQEMKSEKLKKDNLILLAFLQRLMLGKKVSLKWK